jgi:hypothetical protein
MCKQKKELEQLVAAKLACESLGFEFLYPCSDKDKILQPCTAKAVLWNGYQCPGKPFQPNSAIMRSMWPGMWVQTYKPLSAKADKRIKLVK